VPILSDHYFDILCRQLEFCWEMVEHRHKHLINYSDLSAGTCLADYKGFPLIVRDTAMRLAGC